jgi:hypothetical protein
MGKSSGPPKRMRRDRERRFHRMRGEPKPILTWDPPAEWLEGDASDAQRLGRTDSGRSIGSAGAPYNGSGER